jgi:hypothetical protein
MLFRLSILSDPFPMAERPIFIPAKDEHRLVEEIFVPLHWHSGFASVQKEKNVRELHASALDFGLGPLLEVSSKSERIEGRHLSAFHLKVQSHDAGLIPLECAFQGSKVFEYGGPYRDIFFKEGRDAKRDLRIRESGALRGFEFDGYSFALEPKTFFYDWLYISSIYQHRVWLQKLNAYAGFTDIELNPYRSINCQARSIALFLTLMSRNLLDEAVQSPENFRRLLLRFDYRPELRDQSIKHPSLFVERSSRDGSFMLAASEEVDVFPTQAAAIKEAHSLAETKSALSKKNRNSSLRPTRSNLLENDVPERKYR